MSEEQKPKKAVTFTKTLAIAGEFGFIIVLPLLLFAYLGKWLADKYDTKLLLIACIALAVFTSSAWLYYRIMDIFEDLKKL